MTTMKTSLLLFAIVAQIGFAQVASAQPTDRPASSEQSGITVSAWYPGFCDIEPGLPPWCTMPRPYYGTFSILTVSGHYVASASTSQDITATFTVYLRPGRYVIVPDDPALIDETKTVTVRSRQLTEVMIWIGEDGA